MFCWQDLRYAARLLWRQPGFTLLTVAVLAGGLGLSIFTFSFLHTAMLKPLPVPEGERVVRLMARVEGIGLASIDAGDFAALRPAITTLSEVGVYTTREFVVGTGEGTRSLGAVASEWNIFELTRTRALIGRGFTAADQLPGAEPVLVLAHRAWRSVFGGDAEVIGRTVRLSGVPTRVIGVMPPGYGFPVAAEAWVPIDPALLSAVDAPRERIMAYARLAPGATAARADAELSGLLRRAVAARPTADPTMPRQEGMAAVSYPLAQIGEEAPLVLAVLNLIATLILLLACINVTNLLLARANERSRETAVRLALGAPRGRLIMQGLWEVVLLCLLGGAIAVGFAGWLLSAVNGWAQTRLEGNLAFWWVWGLDRSALLAAGGFVTLAIAVLGVIASRRAVNTRINAVLQEGAARAGGRREGRIARWLVVVQVTAVSLLLYFGTLSAVVAWRVVHVNFGYDTGRLLYAGVSPPAERYPDAAARDRLYQALQDQLQLRPELDGVVLRSTLADADGSGGEYEPTGWTGGTLRPRSFVLAVRGALIPLGIGLREGRYFDTRDGRGAEPVVLVSQSLAARSWPGRSPLGAQLRLTGLGDSATTRTVVGVVSDVLLGNPLSRNRSAMAVYVPLEQSDARDVSVLFRHRGGEPAALSAFHEVLLAVDPRVPPPHVSSYRDILAKATVMARSVAWLFGGAFGFALLLAVTGIYGLMARSIGRRTREIGVRRALGATDRTILVMLLGEGGRQLGVGALVALPLMLVVGWGFSRFFLVTLPLAVGAALAVSTTIGAIVLAATLLPTRRAIAVPPRDALWRE
ncbi:MAG: ABC transporter permease [Gemmatimonadales bacterium]